MPADGRWDLTRRLKGSVGGKMPCKRVVLSIGAPLGNLAGIGLPGLFKGKG